MLSEILLSVLVGAEPFFFFKKYPLFLDYLIYLASSITFASLGQVFIKYLCNTNVILHLSINAYHDGYHLKVLSDLMS